MGRRGCRKNNTHRFDALFTPAADVDAEHTVGAPFALSGKAINTGGITERCSHQAAFKVDLITGHMDVSIIRNSSGN